MLTDRSNNASIMQKTHTLWQKYLTRYGETPLPDAPQQLSTAWQNVLVIPAYRESPAFIHNLQAFCKSQQGLLVIVVLNRPESDTDTNSNKPLRDAIHALPPSHLSANLFSLGANNHLLLIDRERQVGATPAQQGVGAARKLGCDSALQWILQGCIASDWICCTDADARLPEDYFSRLPRAQHFSAAVFPYTHEQLPMHHAHYRIAQATQVYERRLYQYVNGLKRAGSPYAFHTLGSAMAVSADCYAKVRGFPKRAGAEDFYLLNKLAKLKPVASLDGQPIRIAPRDSDRVPFGTGPAVKALLAQDDLDSAEIFYDERVFDGLKAVLDSAGDLFDKNNTLASVFSEVDRELRDVLVEQLTALGIDKALEHCRQQSADRQSFLRHFHQWFDGFRSLKLIRGLEQLYGKTSLRCLRHDEGQRKRGERKRRTGVME